MKLNARTVLYLLNTNVELKTFKENRLSLFFILYSMGSWSSGYDVAIISELFDEKIDENFSDIFLRNSFPF